MESQKRMTIKEQIERAKTAELLTVNQVALLIQYVPMTIYRKAWRGEIPGAIRIGRSLHFKRAEVWPWLHAEREVRRDSNRSL